MNQRMRPVPRDIIVRGIMSQLIRLGVVVEQSALSFPQGSPSTISVGPNLGHFCFGDDVEVFPDGVPVISSIVLPWKGSSTLRVTLLEPALSYWTGEIRLFHEWGEPELNRWRPLNLLEGASLLAMDPGLGSVRCQCENARDRCAELFMENGRMYIWNGMTPPSHHVAYTTQPWCVRVDEKQ